MLKMNNCLLTQCRVTPSSPHYWWKGKKCRRLQLGSVALCHLVPAALSVFLFVSFPPDKPAAWCNMTVCVCFLFAFWQYRKLAFHSDRRKRKPTQTCCWEKLRVETKCAPSLPVKNTTFSMSKKLFNNFKYKKISVSLLLAFHFNWLDSKSSPPHTHTHNKIIIK